MDMPSSAGRSKTRPLSPHLQVYRWQLTMVLSILHRMTGAALAVGTLVIAGWIVSVALGPETYDQYAALMTHPIGLLALAGWSWALFYHLLNGIRHLLWDTGKALDIKSVYITGWTVAILSLALTAGVWGAVYAIRHEGITPPASDDQVSNESPDLPATSSFEEPSSHE